MDLFLLTGTDLGFPVGGVDPFWGHGPPMRALFGENVCENERIGSHRGGVHWEILYVDPPVIILFQQYLLDFPCIAI